MGELAQLQQTELSELETVKKENSELKKQLYSTQLAYLSQQRQLGVMQAEKLEQLILQLDQPIGEKIHDPII